MKFNYEKFTEKAFDSGLADEFEAPLFKSKQLTAIEKIDELTDAFAKTLTKEQRAIFEKIEELEIEYEDATEKQAFYKGYMLATSLFLIE